MDTLLSTSTALTTSASAASTGLSTDTQSPAGEGASAFGDIFSSLQTTPQRQDLAAVLFGSQQSIPALVSQPLGNSMAVITPDSPTPGQDSLLAFARSQGLEESAIAALWQTSAGAKGTPLSQTPAAPTPIGLTVFPSLSTPSGPLQAVIAAPAAPSAPAAPFTAPPLPTTEAVPPTRVNPPQALITLLTEPEADMTSLLPPGTPIATQSSPSTPEDNSSLNLAALQQLRAQWMVNPQRALQRPSSPLPLSSTGTSTSNKPPTSSTLTLDLDLERDLAEITALGTDPSEAPPQGDHLPAGAGQPTPQLSASSQGTSSNGTAAAQTASTLSGYQLKAEHYQQLADRMGQALAQRMLEQIDRGQWSMKLRLNPVELGQIDVQLDMRQDGLGAYFQTENPLTKDLIMQGSGRLKDNLSQHGMTIASMTVNSDGERQFSGNSTPQQQQRRAPSTPTASAAPATATLEPVRSKKSPEQGWDVMA